MTASGIMLVLLGFAAWRDFATRTIPDLVSLGIALIGIGTRLFDGWPALGLSLAIAVAVFLVLVPLNAFGLLGGADLKLMAALSISLTPLALYHLFTAVTLVGGVLAALYLALRWLARRGPARLRLAGPLGRHRSSAIHRVMVIETWRIRKRAPLPYGLAIAGGAAFVVLAQPGV